MSPSENMMLSLESTGWMASRSTFERDGLSEEAKTWQPIRNWRPNVDEWQAHVWVHVSSFSLRHVGQLWDKLTNTVNHINNSRAAVHPCCPSVLVFRYAEPVLAWMGFCSRREPKTWRSSGDGFWLSEVNKVVYQLPARQPFLRIFSGLQLKPEINSDVMKAAAASSSSLNLMKRRVCGSQFNKVWGVELFKTKTQ